MFKDRFQLFLVKFCVVACLVFGWSPWAQCQPEDGGSSGKAETRPGLKYTMHLASESGLSAMVPGKWGTLHISMLNARQEPQNLLCSTYLGDDSTLQYARQFWVPGQALLRVDQPVLLPRIAPNAGRSLELHSLVYDVGSNHALIRSEGGSLRHDGALIITHDTRNTAIIGQRAMIPDEVPALVVACRVEAGLNNNVTWLGDAFLPADAASLDALDHIVMADDRLVDDFAATAALRQWLYAGGHLWVMLDRVDPAALQLLLGDDFRGYVVDRLSLASVRVDELPGTTGLDVKPGESKDFEDPVDFVRLDVPGRNVTHVVHDWPAAVSMPYGDGKLLVTTLGARGWMNRIPAEVERPADPLLRSDFRPTGPMIKISDEFFRLRPAPLIPASSLEPQVAEYIGYSIPSWWLIVGSLLAFSVSIVAIGIWLLRSGQLEQICWYGSIPALAISLLLIQAGRTNRQAIPATMATVQLAQVLPGTDDVRCTGVVCTYQPDGSEFPIASTQDARMVPDMTGPDQSSRRMVTTDLGVCHWENLHQPAGVGTTRFEQPETMADRLEARVTFDAHGISGKYTGQLPPGTDAIVATRSGRMGAGLQSDGTLDIRSDSVLESEQYLAAGLLSDEQDRRRRTLKSLLDNPDRPDYPERPQLMFWSEPVDNGLRFGDQMTHLGAALVAVPLVIDRPVSGTEFVIPAPFLDYVNRSNPDGTPSAALWNSDKKQWQERSTPGLTWLSFQIPRELLPVTAAQAQIELSVSGPIGRVDLMGLKSGEVVSLTSIVNPVGSVTIDITDPEALTIDEDGHLSLGLSAGNQELSESPSDGAPDVKSAGGTGQKGKVNYWRIESLALQLSVKATEPTPRN